MSKKASTIETIQSEAHGTYTSYILGFVMSLILTLIAYFAVIKEILQGWSLILVIMGIGIIQLFVQLLFFLHLGSESKPRWNLMVFLFSGMVLVVIVGGSLWIMYSLNERVMPSMNMSQNTTQK